MQMENKNAQITSETMPIGNILLAEVVSWGKDKLLDLLLKNRYYLTDYDYNSSLENLAENFIHWCNSKSIDVYNFR
jgi:hypothetical protein